MNRRTLAEVSIRVECRDLRRPREAGIQPQAGIIVRSDICTEGRVDSDIHSTYNGFSVDADYYLISHYAASYNPTLA